MRYSDFILILRDYKWIVLTPVLLSLLLAAGIGLFFPKSYTAWSEVVIEARSSDPAIAVSAQAMPGFIATQVDILRSERLAEHVVDQLSLERNSFALTSAGAQEDRASNRFKLIQWLQKNSAVRPARDSGVVAVGFTAKSPDLAQAISNAMSQGLVDIALELKVAAARSDMLLYEEGVKESRAELSKARAALSDFQVNNNILSSGDSTDVESAKLAELTSQLVNLQNSLLDTRSRETLIAKRGGQSLPEVLENRSVQTLKAEVARLEGSLLEMQENLGPAHPRVKSTLGELQGARERLEAESQRTAGSIGISTQSNTLREQQLKIAIEEQRARILQLRGQRDRAALLASEVDRSQRSFDSANQRLMQATIESRYKQTNVGLLNGARSPLEPSSPRMPLALTVCLFLGLTCGIGGAALLELRSPKVRSADLLLSALGTPVLAVLGDQGSATASKLLPHERRSQRLEQLT